MRVIAGIARGIKLKAPEGLTVRPTADRVKEALFNILGVKVIGALFIDLYAGSGAVGIEALSRGAERAVFVDNRRENIILIKENLDRTKLAEQARLVSADVAKAIVSLAREGLKADILFIDPPYDIPDLATFVKSLLESCLLAKNGLLVVEHAYKNRQWGEGFANVRLKKYGDTGLTFITGTE